MRESEWVEAGKEELNTRWTEGRRMKESQAVELILVVDACGGDGQSRQPLSLTNWLDKEAEMTETTFLWVRLTLSASRCLAIQ